MAIKIGTTDIKDIYVGTGNTNYRYLRWTITANRNNINVTQMSEFEICNSSGTKMARPSGTTITGNIVGPGTETVDKLIDGSTSTKYCPNGSLPIIITITLGSTVDFSIYNKYKRYTANDENGRDPVSWTIEASNDGSNWTTISSVSNATITTNRYSLAGTWSFTTKGNVSAVYVGTTKVRPTWQPGENTYIYYPLTSDLKDVMGNGNTGTMHGTCTFDSSTGIHVTGRSSNYVTGMSLGVNNRNTFTLNVWVKLDNIIDTGQCIIGYSTNYMSTQARKLEFWTNNPGIDCSICYGNNAHITRPSSKDTNWHNYCLVGDGTKYQWYYDGEPLGSAINTSAALNNVSELQLGWGGIYGSGRSANGYIKDYIVETVARTAQEVADYFNRTKSLYGVN